MNEREVASLLESLCVKSGFCLKPDDRQRLMESPPADAEHFTDEVFPADGLEPSFDKRLYAQVLEIVQAACTRAEARVAHGG